MNEFIYQYSGFVTKLLELIAAIVGTICFSKYRQTPVKYFIYFLWYVFILECIGGYTVYVYKYESLSHIKAYLSNTWMEHNDWWYTINWTIGGSLFYTFYFRSLLTSSKLKKVLKYLAFIFIAFSIVNIIIQWEDFFVTTITEISLFATILTVLSILFYLIEVLKSEKILNFYRSVNVYISLSVLLWTVTIAPLAFFSMYFNQQDWSYVYMRTNIIFFANVFLYTTFAVGLKVSNPELK